MHAQQMTTISKSFGAGQRGTEHWSLGAFCPCLFVFFEAVSPRLDWIGGLHFSSFWVCVCLPDPPVDSST